MNDRLSWRDRLTRHYYLRSLVVRLVSQGLSSDQVAASFGIMVYELCNMLRLLETPPWCVTILGPLSHIPAPQFSRWDVLAFWGNVRLDQLRNYLGEELPLPVRFTDYAT